MNYDTMRYSAESKPAVSLNTAVCIGKLALRLSFQNILRSSYSLFISSAVRLNFLLSSSGLFYLVSASPNCALRSNISFAFALSDIVHNLKTRLSTFAVSTTFDIKHALKILLGELTNIVFVLELSKIIESCLVCPLMVFSNTRGLYLPMVAYKEYFPTRSFFYPLYSCNDISFNDWEYARDPQTTQDHTSVSAPRNVYIAFTSCQLEFVSHL